MIAVLPYPPSSNRLWRMYRGKLVKSDEARAYEKQVRLRWLAQVPVRERKPLQGEVVLSLHIYRPRRAGDTSNRLKLLEDCLEGLAYANDEQVAEIHMRRDYDSENPRVVVTVEAA